MAAKEGLLPQRVVVYDCAEENARVYVSAYTDSQVEQALVRCRGRYGKKAKCRVMTAEKRAPS